MKGKILTVVGARPQFIKLAPVSRQLRQHFKEIIVHTGQHYNTNMSDVFFQQLGIPEPDYNLNVGSGKHGEQTGKMMMFIEEKIIELKPDFVLVYGDTNSTLAGALCGSKLHIPVIHVEAGLRSFNKRMPEEVNRIVTDHVSEMLFTSSEIGVKNLLNEGITRNVFNVGDVMYDAVVQNLSKAANLKTSFNNSNNYILLTLHRAENTDNKSRMLNILKGLMNIEKEILWPMHPRTKKYLQEYGVNVNDYPNIKVIEPVGYLEMLSLMNNAEKVVTDSGGVQKEAYFMKKPCITLRDETEWLETVEIGVNKLVGANSELIAKEGNNFTVNFTEKQELYGNGNASEMIASKILEYIK